MYDGASSENEDEKRNTFRTDNFANISQNASLINHFNHSTITSHRISKEWQKMPCWTHVALSACQRGIYQENQFSNNQPSIYLLSHFMKDVLTCKHKNTQIGHDSCHQFEIAGESSRTVMCKMLAMLEKCVRWGKWVKLERIIHVCLLKLVVSPPRGHKNTSVHFVRTERAICRELTENINNTFGLNIVISAWILVTLISPNRQIIFKSNTHFRTRFKRI